MRTVESDACSSHDPCLHGGECVSTDAGPMCDCGEVDFEGPTCENREWLKLMHCTKVDAPGCMYAAGKLRQKW